MSTIQKDIHLQVSWFTLRAWTSDTYHSYKMYITFEEMCKHSFRKGCLNMLSDAGIWREKEKKKPLNRVEIYTHPRVARLHTQCGH